MNSKKAIEILKIQIEKLDNPKIRKDENWIFQTASYIKDFFGKESAEYSFISNFNFKVPFNQYDNKSFPIEQLNLKILKSRQYLENCIETIKVKGLYKHPKPNFISRISETALWAIISISIPGLLTIGGLFGNMISENKNVELKIENKKLKDSILTLKNLSQPITHKNSDTINNNNKKIQHNN